GDLVADAPDRVEGMHGPLEDHRGPRPADRAQMSPPHGEHVLALQQDLSGDVGRRGQQSQQRQGHGGLAASGLARQPEGAARLQEQVRTANRRNVLMAAGAVGDPKVPNIEEGCQCASMSRGLMTDSTARPHRVNDRATTAIARPGGIMYHQMPALIAPAVRADSRMPPPETVVGSPMPRKARVGSAMMEVAARRVVWASTTGMTVGSTGQPMACAPAAR